MSTFTDLIQEGKRINLRSIIAFKRLGGVVVRVATNRTKPNKERHPEITRTNDDFKGARKFCSAFTRTMKDYPAWSAAAKLYGKNGQTGDNFMLHMNHDKLVKKVVACFHLFRFSVGPRSLPWNLAISANGNEVTITWSDSRKNPHCSPRDQLLVGIILESAPGRPLLFSDNRVTRDCGDATFSLSPTRDTVAHCYVIFCNQERTEFSDSMHLAIPVTKAAKE